MVVWALLASAVSITLQGFEFPTANNFFHLPIVIEYVRTAEGPHDAFHATLDNFASVVWPLLRPFATEWNAGWVFLAAHWLSRAGIVLSFYGMLRSLLSARWAAAAGAVLILPFISTFFSATIVGQSEQLPRGFTHSEVAIALVLGALALSLKRRFVLAGLMLGICVNVNAFYAVWGVAALGVARLFELRERPGAAWWRETLWAVVALALAAAPMTYRIVMHELIAAPAVAPFDYVRFLADYWPYHFLIQYVAVDHLAFVIVILTQSIIAFRYALTRRDLAVIALAFGGLFALGIVAPLLTGSRLLLNMHLLRSDTMIVYLFAAAAIAAAIDVRPSRARQGSAGTWAWLAVFALVVGSWPASVLALGSWLVRHEALPATARHIVAGTLAATAAVLFVPGLNEPLAAAGPILSLVAPQAAPTVLPMPHLDWDLTRIILLTGSIGFLAWAVLAPSPVLVACALATGSSVADLPFGIGVAIVTVLALVWRDDVMPRRIQALLVVAQIAAAVICAFFTPSLLGKALLAMTVPTGLAVLASGYFSASAFGAGLARMRVAGVTTCLALAILIPTAAQAVIQLAPRPGGGGFAEGRGEVVGGWLEIQWWARNNTPPDTVFMVPLDMAGFSIQARRPVWVDWKSGAAVMWEPAFYWVWRPRIEAQRMLQDVAAKVAYARANGIGFVIVRRAEAERSTLRPVFANSQFSVFAAGAR